MTVLTDQAETVDRVWWIFFWAAVAVGAAVTLLLVFCVVRFRKRDDRLPTQVHHSRAIEVVYTVVPLLIVAGLTGVTIDSLAEFDDAEQPDVTVRVIGYQWQWRFEYPDTGVAVTGTSRDDRPVLVLPSESVVRFELTSLDVVHSFWVPEFRFKRDIWPGELQRFDVRVGDRTGEFVDVGACGEFCGLDHAAMRFSLRVVPPAEFDTWLADAAAEGTSP